MGKIGLVISREFAQRVRKKSFIITTLLAPLAMVALFVLPALIMKYTTDDADRTIVVVDGSQEVGAMLAASDTMFVNSTATYPEVLDEYPEAYGFLIIGHDIVENPNNMKLYTRQASTVATEGNITSRVSALVTDIRIKETGVDNLDSLMRVVAAKASLQTFEIGKDADGGTVEKESSSSASMIIAYIAGFIIYMFILMYGMMVLQGVVEEKSSRIIEVIVSSVKPFELMMGKIVGVALVALLQFGIWVIVCSAAFAFLPAMADGLSIAGMAPGGAMSMLLDPFYMFKVVGSFIVFFVGGYLLYAAMFAAIGSAVDSVADTQQLQMPVTMPLIIAIMVMLSVMQNPHSAAAFWFSIIPFTSPIIMVARVAYGVPLWEFLLSAAILYGSFVGMTYVAAKIYRTGIFMYGKKPTFRELIRWARYKG